MQRENILIRFSHGTAMHFAKETTLLEMSHAQSVCGLYKEAIAGAIVDNRVCDLQTKIKKDSLVTFFPINTPLGMEAYKRTLTFVLMMAVAELYDGITMVEHSLSKGLFCELRLPQGELTRDMTKAIRQQMKEIIEEDRPIVRRVYNRLKVIEYVEENGKADERAQLLRQLDRTAETVYSGSVMNNEAEDTITLYQCDEHYIYLYGPMLPSTGCLKKFDLMHYASGVVLRYPINSPREAIPAFVNRPKLAEIFAESEDWAHIMHCPYVADLNQMIEENRAGQVIRLAEALHEKKIAQIADKIMKRGSALRLILIAGPSSSGKTTFAQRLSVQLRVNGINPVPISVDDYFHNREDTPLDEHGNYDFESINAVDVELLNEHLTKLLTGEEIELPYYNFKTGKREYRGKKLQLKPDEVLVVEGIHALNEKMTYAIERSCKMKIYISALTQLSIDRHNRIPTTDTRLIRRIVRDNRYRGRNAVDTLRGWYSVRNGEEKNIFPYQEEADVMFNSALLYELAELKKHAKPLLEAIEPNVPEFIEAQRLLNFLNCFKQLPNEDDIPLTSILGEFIGRSGFGVND